MIRSKRRTFSLLLGGAILLAACGGRAEQTVGPGTLDASGGTSGAVTETDGDGGTGGVSSNGGGVAMSPSGSAGNGGTGVAIGSGGAVAADAGRMPATAGMAALAAGTSGAAGAVDCNTLLGELDAAYKEARACDPSAAEDECTTAIVPPFGCQTPDYFNPANADAIARFTGVAQAMVDARCPVGNAGACASVIRGRCNPSDGVCLGVPAGNGRNCWSDQAVPNSAKMSSALRSRARS
jgi:hypothetical protein